MAKAPNQTNIKTNLQNIVELPLASLPTKIAELPNPIVKTQPAASTQTVDYKLYIYNHESGDDPTRWNNMGCVGLGQACPSSKLLAVCPTLDYACEDAWFTRYADKYGGWEGAYQFWLSHHWW